MDAEATLVYRIFSFFQKKENIWCLELSSVVGDPATEGSSCCYWKVVRTLTEKVGRIHPLLCMWDTLYVQHRLAGICLDR